jgi:hypothetical protein
MGKVKFDFDPFEIAGVDPKDIPASKREETLELIADFVLESVLSYVGDGNSPVSGHGKFPALSKDYKKRKVAEGGTPVPNLLLEGDLLDSLTVKRSRNTLTLTVDGALEDKKADNHNGFGIYGTPTLPERRFIPAENEMFKRDITEGIKRFVEDALDED